MERRKFFGASVAGAAGIMLSRQAQADTTSEIKTYPSIAEMINDTSIQLYDVVETLGYYSAGDGGGATYDIADATLSDDDAVDGGSVINLNHADLQAILRKSGTVSARQFGIRADNTDELDGIIALEKYARNHQQNIYFPAGVYNSRGRLPFYTNANGAGDLLEGEKDYRNITVYGDGKNTILKTTTENGADVLNLNTIKNLTIRDLSLTATLTGTGGAGSNGVSITGNCSNIEIRNVDCFDLPYLAKSGPNYIDGGKAFSMQYGSLTKRMDNIRFVNCTARNCGYGFGLDSPFEVFQDAAPEVVVNGMYVENCYRGFVLSAAHPVREVPVRGVNCGVRIENAVARNCQQGLSMALCDGAYVRVKVRTTKSVSDLLHGVSFDEEVYGAAIIGVKYGNIGIDGHMYVTQSILKLGATTRDNTNNILTEQTFIQSNLIARFADNAIVPVASNTSPARNCKIESNFYVLPDVFKSAELNNLITEI